MGNDYNNNKDKKDELPENDSLLEKKRKRPLESEDEGNNIIKKFAKLKEEIDLITLTKIEKKKEKMKKEIEEKEKDIKLLDRFEKIKKELNELLKASLYKNSINSGIIYDNREKQTFINDIRKTINEYWNNNKKELKPLYQSLNSENKKIVNNELKSFEKQVLNEYLNSSETIISHKSKNKGKVIDMSKKEKNLLKEKLSDKSRKEEKYRRIIYLEENENQEQNYRGKKSNSEKKNYSKNNTNEIYQSKKEEVKNTINSEIVQTKEDEFNNYYTFNCLTKDLDFIVSKGTKQVVFTLELENNGKFPWPKNKTTLSNDLTKSIIQMKEIVLEPLNPGEITSINVMLNEIDKFKAGEYYCYLEFKVDGKCNGNNIAIKIKITDKDIKYENKTLIKAFNNYYNLPKSVASDTMIVKELYRRKTFENTCDNLLKSYDEQIQENKNKIN